MHSEKQIAALNRATNGRSFANYQTIYSGFITKGIAESDIKPRINVFTFVAWRLLGRTVKKGEKGVRVLAFRNTKTTDEKTGETKVVSSPWYSTVFHISQTEPTKPRGN